MAQGKAAWGIEVGAYEIKAIRLQDGGPTGVEVTDFAVIPHKKVLTEPDIDQNEVIRLSLGQLISQKELEGENLVMSVPGHSAFARFAKFTKMLLKSYRNSWFFNQSLLIVRVSSSAKVGIPIGAVQKCAKLIELEICCIMKI